MKAPLVAVPLLALFAFVAGAAEVAQVQVEKLRV
ncbi:hypothetical protein X737_32695 [Mesorhizobium sp. L48C026A00]|nr:hypothetical protein X737_32695 [Mesorhizobium sp. L48C026A00]